MGNLLLDASSPAIVWNAGSTSVSSASFTPPANSLVVVGWAGNTGSGDTPPAPGISGGGLTYTLHQHAAQPDGSAEGQAAMWSAPASGGSVTVTVTSGSAATGVAVKVWVWTDDAGLLPQIGASKKGQRNTTGTAVADSYTALYDGSRGLMAWAEWNAAGVATAGTGCTLTGGGAANQSPTLAYAFLLRTTADGVAGASTTMNLTTPSTNQNRWAIVEVAPGASPPVAYDPPTYWPGAGPWGADRFVADPYPTDTGTPAPEVVLTEATTSWSAVAVSPVPQPVAVTITPALCVWSTAPVTPTPGAVAVTVTPTVATWAAVAVTATPAVSLTPATASWTAVPVVSTPAVPVTPATASWAAVAVTPTPGATAVTVTPATAAWSAVAVTPTPQPVARTLTPVTASWAAVSVSPVPQPVQVTLTAATATWAAQACALTTPGALTALPATTSWSAVTVAPTPGQMARTVTPATTSWSARPVVATPAATLTAATTLWSAVVVSAVPGQLAMTLTTATAAWQAQPMVLAGAGAPGYISARTSPSGRTSGRALRAGGASTTTGARIDGTATNAGKVDGNVL